jgi:hypothetical protein
MTSPLRYALVAVFSVTCCAAQTATVTFYSPGASVKNVATEFLPKSEQPFGGLQGGWIFDGPQRLARVRMGRFVTFHLIPGEHYFTDAGPTGPSKKPLVINAEDGGQYCVRLFAKMINLGIYGKWENEIEEVPCQQAQRETARLKPVEIKRVAPAVSAEFDSKSTFPGDVQLQH